jgi:tRNA 2-thiocytidine biosynthesis protein TtcA
MNLSAKGELSTMPVKLVYRKFPVTIIRPLALLEERQIIACAAELGILQRACACPYGANSHRQVIRKKIADFTGGSGAVKRRIFSAVMPVTSLESPPVLR